jgi:hypothetical protein
MRRVWVFALIAVLAVSAVVAGSAGYLYFFHTEGEYDKPSGIEENETVQERDGTADTPSTAKSERMAGIMRDQISTVENGSKHRYINKYESAEENRNWILEEGNVSLGNPEVPIYEVTRYPDDEPTKQYLNNSWELYNRTYEAAARNGWFEYKNAVKQGYIDYVLADGVHHYNASYYLDGEILNPEKPESLIYYENPENKSNEILVGVMYQNMKKEGEQVGGPLTIWHYHPIIQRKLRRLNKTISQETRYDDYEQLVNEAYKKVPEDRLNRTGEMIHVWFVEHPEGPFGTTMSVPSSSLKNPEKMARKEFTNRVTQAHENRLKKEVRQE